MYTLKYLTVWASLIFLLTGCTSKPSKCAIESLILEESVFPNETFIEQLISPLPDEPKESAARSFYYAPDAVYHEVINWHSVNAAKRDFESKLKSVFDVDKYMGPWESPDGLYISPMAENYQVACGIAHKIYQCRMIATYSRYSVFLGHMCLIKV